MDETKELLSKYKKRRKLIMNLIQLQNSDIVSNKDLVVINKFMI